MGTVSRSYDFANGTTADADQVDTELNAIYSEFNGNIDNANIKAGAAIAESKIAFSGSGHGHGGGTDGKTITQPTLHRGFSWYIPGTLATGNAQGVKYSSAS